MIMSWEHRASLLWPQLTQAAKERRLLNYSELKDSVRLNAQQVGWALGPIQTYCLDSRLPPLTVIVVRKNDSIPGDGFIAWDVDDFDTAKELVFNFDWGLIDNPFGGFAPTVSEESLAEELVENPDNAEDVYRLVKDRGIAQRVFRKALLEAYDYQCAFCKLSFEDALDAAHIVRWTDCSKSERMDVRNGMLLCKNHHILFDCEEITITSDYRIQYSDPKGLDGPYSEADKSTSLRLHTARMNLPKNTALHPRLDFISKRRKDDEWD